MATKLHARAKGAKVDVHDRMRTKCSRNVDRKSVRVNLKAGNPDNCQRCEFLTLRN